MKTYDPVDAAKRLQEELIITLAYLEEVSKQLQKLETITMDNISQWEELYAKEFELSMKLSGIIGDIELILLRQMTSYNEFQLKRIYQESAKLFQPLVVEMKK